MPKSKKNFYVQVIPRRRFSTEEILHCRFHSCQVQLGLYMYKFVNKCKKLSNCKKIIGITELLELAE